MSWARYLSLLFSGGRFVCLGKDGKEGGREGGRKDGKEDVFVEGREGCYAVVYPIGVSCFEGQMHHIQSQAYSKAQRVVGRERRNRLTPHPYNHQE